MTVVTIPFTVEGWTVISEFFFKVFVLVTTHITSNIGIDLEGSADTASMTAHTIATHVRPDSCAQAGGHFEHGVVIVPYLVKDSNDGL